MRRRSPYYSSSDATVSSDDTALASGTRTIAVLTAGSTSGQQTIEIPATATTSVGTFNYGACVTVLSEESNSTDNCAATTLQVTATPQPDLVPVGPPTFDAMSYENGATITVRARLTNSGTANSRAGASVEFYRVNDGDDDVLVATVSDIAIIGADLNSAVIAATFIASAPVGTQQYYFKIEGEGMSGDANIRNNMSALSSVTIIAPDLVPVGPPTFGAASYENGSTVTIRAQLRNSGTANSSADTSASVKFYREAGASDVLIDTVTGLDAIAAGANSAVISVTFAALAPKAPVGTQQYYFKIEGTAMSGETNITNNTSALGSVTITAPDLVPAVQTGQSNTGPTFGAASYVHGSTITIRAQLRNSGLTASSTGARVRFYREVRAGDVLVATVPNIATIIAGGTSPVIEATFTAGSPIGMQQYYFIVDMVSGETDTDNNMSAVGSVTITAPDLVPATQTGQPDTGPTFGAASYRTGTDVTITAAVRNRATASNGSSNSDGRVAFFVSGNAMPVATVGLPPIAPAAMVTVSATFAAPATAGNYSYSFVIQNVSGETAIAHDNTKNNSASTSLTVTGDPPDLTGSIALGVTTAKVSTTLTAGVITFNNVGGTDSVPTTFNAYYYTGSSARQVRPAADGATPADTELALTFSTGTNAVPVITSASSSSIAAGVVSFTVPSTAGSYYIGICIVSVTGETNTANNCQSGVPLTVTPLAPDLTITAASISGTSAIRGTALTGVSVTVRNIGDAQSSVTTVRFQIQDVFRSSFFRLTNTIAVPILAPNAEMTFAPTNIIVPSTVTSFANYSLQTVVSVVSGEVNTSNNVRTVLSNFDVRDPSDLIIQSFAVDTTTVVRGSTFVPTVVVRNDGLAASSQSRRLSFHLHRVSDNTAQPPIISAISVPVLAAETNSASLSGMVTIPSSVTPDTYYITVVVSSPVASGNEVDTDNNSAVLGGGTPTVFTIN